MKEMFHDWQNDFGSAHDWRHEAKWGFMQARRGDMRPIILRVLKTKPMHGYEIIRHLEEKSHGMWRPSPGSVYPTLQLLEEEDLVTAKESDGKKIYELTSKGKKEAEQEFEGGPWAKHSKKDLEKILPLRRATAELIKTQRKIVHGAIKRGDYGVIERIVTALQETKQKIEQMESERK